MRFLSIFDYLQWKFQGSGLPPQRGLWRIRSLVLGIVFCCGFALYGDTLLVVERGRSRVAVIRGQKKVAEVEGLGVLHHATIKFGSGYGWVLSRDGWLNRIRLTDFRKAGKVRVGKSSIGLVVSTDYVYVANYDPPSVVILDTSSLKVHHKLITGSRNVGIKKWRQQLVFSLMDKGEVWRIHGTPPFSVLQKQRVGGLPFDALLVEGKYVVGFFRSPKLWIWDLKRSRVKALHLLDSKKEPIFKIPHFGAWAIRGKLAYIPAIRAKKVYVLHLNQLQLVSSFSMPGHPIFVKLSPKGRHLAVNYSGDKEDVLSIYSFAQKKWLHKKVGERILHFGFSSTGQYLYFSSFYENSVKIWDVDHQKVVGVVRVATPSGIFVVPEEVGK